MPVILQSIVPKRALAPAPEKVKQRLKQNLLIYLETVKEKLQEYPPPPPPRPNRRRSASEQTRLEQEAALRGELPPSPISRYRPYKRTFNLQKNWKVVPSPDGSGGFVFNTLPYAGYVQGPRASTGTGTGPRQRRLHRRIGWRSITDVSRETRKLFVDVVNKAITSE